MEINLDYIKKLTENNEGVDVEFKETTAQLKRGMESLCGMINGNGGLVVFGIADDKTVKGQQIGDKTTQDIGVALNKFDPSIDIQPVYIPFIKDKYLIAFYSDGLESDKPN